MNNSRTRCPGRPSPHRRTSPTRSCASSSTQGLDAVSIRAVARAAGVSIGTVQYHFATKDDLLLAAYERAIDQVTARARAVAAEDPDPATYIRSLLRELLPLDDRREAELRVALAFSARSVYSPRLTELYTAGLPRARRRGRRRAAPCGRARRGGPRRRAAARRHAGGRGRRRPRLASAVRARRRWRRAPPRPRSTRISPAPAAALSAMYQALARRSDGQMPTSPTAPDAPLAAAVLLGWRVAELYALVDDTGLPASDTLLPAHGSLEPADQLELQLRAACGDARRAGVTSKGAALDELVAPPAPRPGLRRGGRGVPRAAADVPHRGPEGPVGARRGRRQGLRARQRPLGHLRPRLPRLPPRRRGAGRDLGGGVPARPHRAPQEAARRPAVAAQRGAASRSCAPSSTPGAPACRSG